MRRLALHTTAAFLLSSGAAWSQTSYKVEDAYTQMRDEIRKLMEPAPVPGNWFSITAVGAVAEADDPNGINELANFCPDPSEDITRFGGIRPIDLLYEKAIDSMVAPVHKQTQDELDANAVLYDSTGKASPKYIEYKKYLDRNAELLAQMSKEKDQGNLDGLLVTYRNFQKDWKVQGFKSEIEGALFRIDALDGLFGPVHNQNRKDILTSFRDHGLTAIWQIGSFKSPASEVSPPVTEWEKPSGWFKTSFDNTTYVHNSNSTSHASSSGGFLHIGGFIGAGTRGSGDGSSYSLDEVKDYAYSFEIKRIRIIRGWLDPRVFGTVGGWAWRKRGEKAEYPLISGGYNAENISIAPEFVVYDNLPVECPMIPSELVIARNRSITLTTSRDEYNKVVSSGGSSSGGMFGGIIGGRKSKSWTTTEIRSNGDSVTFRVEAPGTAVIGLISQLVGRLPDPDTKLEWPADAWLEGEK